MKRFLVAILLTLFAIPCYGADVAQNAVTDGSATVADTHYLNGYTGTTSQRYTISSILGLKTSVTGTSGGLSGTPNITVGTISAGATGFSVDADGDMTAKSINIGRTAGVTSMLDLYEIPANGDSKISIKPPDALAVDVVITTPGTTGTLLSTAAAITPAQGGTGVANGANNTITFTGNYTFGATLTGNTAVTFPTSGTLATLSGAANIATTGTLQGSVIYNSYAEATTLTAAVHNGSVVQMTVAGEVTMWDCETAGVGQFVTLWARDAEKIEVVPASGDHFNLFAGTALTADYELDMAATAGTKVTLMCTADDTWSVYNETAACADGGAAD